MYMMSLTALMPIVWIMLSLGVWKMPGHKTGSITLLISLVLAVIIWKMPVSDALTAILEGTVLAIWPIILVIIAEVFTYNLSIYTKSMDVIKKMMTSIATDKRIQVLILAWGFGGFLEAITAKDVEKISFKTAFLAWLPFVLVFAFIIFTSPLFPPVNKALSMIQTSVAIYSGAGAKPYTFLWVATPRKLIIIATFIGGLIQGVTFKEITSVLFKTVKQMSKSVITIIAIVALAKVMGYSGKIV